MRAAEATPLQPSSGSSKPASDRSACQTYVRAVLALYLRTPGVFGRVRRADRQLAHRLFEQQVPLYAALFREMLERPLGYRDIDELRRELGIGPLPL